jgi:hypothetical protein
MNSKAWPLWGLLLLALLGPPILAIVLVSGLPRTPSANGSILGMDLFPFAALVLLVLLGYRAAPGAKRVVVTLVTLASGLLSWLLLFIGMMAP